MALINLHEVTTDKTVKDFLSGFQLNTDFTSSSFLSINILQSESLSVTNEDVIKACYSKDELEKITANPDSIIIKSGTQVGLPNSALLRQTSSSTVMPDKSELTEFTPFIADQLKTLLKDPNYYVRTADPTGQTVVRTEINELTVYAWIRSLSTPGDNSQQGSWYNISSLVENITTTVTKSAGSFAINLIPVSAIYEPGIGWSMDGLENYQYGNVGDDVLIASILSRYKNKQDNFISRQPFFFEKVMQENDLIYIRFEKLAMEDQIPLLNHAFSAQDVPGKVYDMIGLVDTVSVSTNLNSVSTNVQGRDLMKVLIEDGSYFFPEQFAQQLFTNDESVLTKRNNIDLIGNALIAIGYNFKSIEIILKYVFNKFSNIGLVPSNIFDAYGARAGKFKYELKSSNLVLNDNTKVIDEINSKFLNEERQGIWRIIEMIFDTAASGRITADNTIATDNGSIINTFRKVCQEPFIEFYGDTYGDKYYFIIRKMPFDEKGYKGLVYGDVSTEEINDSVNSNKRITQVTKSVNDEVKKNAENRIKQRLLAQGRNSLISDYVIDIDESDVIRDSFVYSNEIYSWYRLIPRGLGVQNDISSFLLAPVVPLDEYAEVWGNKTYTQEYNYCPASIVDDNVKDKNLKYGESQVFLDLQYIIQSHAYLPFTRQGGITLNGNRTIKRGMFIYYKPTDEIFYVDAVSHSRSLNERITTLQVSRGMREKYIKGVMVKFPSGVKKVSYFDIVNTKIDNNASISNNDFLKNWKVDKDLFNYFLQRRQWVD